MIKIKQNNTNESLYFEEKAHEQFIKNLLEINPNKDDDSYFSVAYPEFAQWLLNKDEGYYRKKKSHVKTNWVCPDCGNIIKNISFAKVATRKHLPCRRCSDGVSFPNKVMYNLLKELNVDFTTEYSPYWVAPKRYDFFIPSKDLIIEMDGSIGHGGKTFLGEIENGLLEIDKLKDESALQHGIKVIRIDSKESNIDYISNNIIHSDISQYFNLSDIDWKTIEKNSFSSLQMKVISLWEKYKNIPDIIEDTKLSRITIVRYLNKGAKSGICSYDAKNQQHISGKRNISKAYNKNKKAVICIDTGQIFESCKEANKWLGYSENGHTIRDNCNGLLKTAGKHPTTKKKLHWMFYDEYLKKEVA